VRKRWLIDGACAGGAVGLTSCLRFAAVLAFLDYKAFPFFSCVHHGLGLGNRLVKVRV